MKNSHLNTTIVILCLLLVAGKMTYNIYSVVFETESKKWEQFFNLGILCIIFYFSTTQTKKSSRNVKPN